MSGQALLIFARNLRYGQVKTRLAATVGHDRAFQIYKQLLEHTAAVTSSVPGEKMVFYSEQIDCGDEWDARVFEKHVQSVGDLGERMHHALATILDKGYPKAVIIGTDCFELTSTIIMNAFVYLEKHDVVIGPAKDGGYYLLGIKKLQAALFKNISWSTDKVLHQTLTVCEQHSLSTCLLPELSDIDDENDWKTQSEQRLLNKR